VKLHCSAGPSRRVLLALVAGVLLAHGVVLLGSVSPLSLQMPAPTPAASVQLRVLAPSPEVVHPPVPRVRPLARRAVQTAAQPAQVPDPAPAAPVAEVAETVPESVAAPAPESAASAPVLAAPEPAPAPATPSAPPAPLLAADKPSPDAVATQSLSTLPLISLGALPPSCLLSYQLTGMDKGLNYHASGELRWQHNDTAYELALSVRAFLLGNRHWRSAGQIDATGLAPRRFSDSWRNERAAHFDREQQRIVFSSNSKPAPLQPGAQDQVSLYVQLAAAMAGEPERFVPGTRLQVQTATVRDALPWALVLDGTEPQTVDGQIMRTLKWVAQPRHQYDTRLEFWVAQSQAWLPVRIRITQASGSYIDLVLRGADPLPPLPLVNNEGGVEKKP
jgi:hypothetical protein